MAGQHAGAWWQAGLMLLMALVCLPCVPPLWRSGSVPAARMLMGGALVMVAVHTVLLLAPGAGGSGHQHGGAVPGSVPPSGTGPDMLALIGWELVVAMLAATWLRRCERNAAQRFDRPAGEDRPGRRRPPGGRRTRR